MRTHDTGNRRGHGARSRLPRGRDGPSPSLDPVPGTGDSVTPGEMLEAPKDGATAAPAAATANQQAAVRTVDPAGFSLPADVQGQPLERLPARQPLTTPAETKPRSLVLRRPVVLAAGHVQFGPREIRLAGLVTPAGDRRCEADGRSWDCGRAASLAFRNYLRARAMVCTVPREKWTGPVDASCTVGNDDPARWLAEQGWAEAEAGSPMPR